MIDNFPALAWRAALIFTVLLTNVVPGSLTNSAAAQPATADLSPTARQIIAEREQRDRTVWKPEVDAQAYERVFLTMWDALRANNHGLDVAQTVTLRRIGLPTPAAQRSLDWGIVETTFRDPPPDGDSDHWLAQPEFIAWLTELQSKGFRLQESEWHHSEFQPAADNQAARSSVSFLLHVVGPEQRIVLRGKLQVQWTADSTATDPQLDSIRVTSLKSFSRQGPTAFEPLALHRSAGEEPSAAQPLILHDLNGDGRSEIVLGESNVVYGNLGGGQFSAGPFLADDVGLLVNGIIADFDRDGIPDFAGIARDYKLYRFEPNERGQFERIEQPACDLKFDRPQVFSAGDVDGDGDLDLWVGQYKPPYVFGQMPTPYYDANDGFPDYLLINDGTGTFHDGTAQANLAAKAHRRTYAGSLVDLNDDGNLDLVVVSDFSGVDVYHNDGSGRFTDVTEQVLPERHTFGMSHSLADYDLNGQIDLYVIGMSSTTARRLSKLGLGLEHAQEIQEMRPVMGYGNRMYLNADQGRFEIPPFNDQVARTGWSWGCSSFDFDNDGDRDIYVANGHRSGDSCQDYCTTFWRHDIYLQPSGADPDVAQLFGVTTKALHANWISWNGYEHNKLLMNLDGQEFVDIAWLLGVALEADSRAVVSDDLDGDGRVDLLVTTYKARSGEESFRLHVFLNRLETGNHWIGLRLNDSADGGSTIGARVTAHVGERELIHQVVTGDSFTAQHAPVVHFGLGEEQHVAEITVRWADGRSTTLSNPEIDRYHELSTTTGK